MGPWESASSRRQARSRNEIVASLLDAVYSRYLRLRLILDRVPGLGPWLRFLSEIKASLLDSSRRDRIRVEKLYRKQNDPYGFLREAEKVRFLRAEQLLDSVCDGRLFTRGLEIGCAEGLFTEQLARRCRELLAVDLSPTALTRARERCRNAAHVRFREWDLRHDLPPGQFDLIVAVGVLEYLRRPAALRKVRQRLVQALRPGGYILVGNTRAEGGGETSWWGRWLLRGTWINAFIAHHPGLETIASAEDECACRFAHVLLRKVDCPINNGAECKSR